MPTMSDPHTPPKPATRCPACNGRGYIRCDCWPGDCICGFDDEPCDECCGTGVAGYEDYLDGLDDHA